MSRPSRSPRGHPWINAFTLGAQKVNPNVTVDVVTSTWFNLTTEKEAAQSLLNKGIDVIGQHQDTLARVRPPRPPAPWWVGYNDDMSRFAPKAWLTAPTWDWGPFYIKTVKDVMAGTWKSEQYYGTMADGLVKAFAPVSDSVPADIRAAIADTQKQIISGEFAPFTGPISKQDGASAYAAGAKATPRRASLKMDYFVKGVNGSATGKG